MVADVGSSPQLTGVLHKDSASAVILGRRGPCRYALPPLCGCCSDGHVEGEGGGGGRGGEARGG